MKTTKFLFVILITAAMAACTTGDSPILKQARTMQEAMMKSCQALDSNVTGKITELESKLTEMSQDTNLNSDTIKMGTYVEIKERYNRLLDSKTKIDNWRIGVKLIPTPEEIAKGAENPYGKEAKDEDVLANVKSMSANFSELKADIEEITK